jgi:ADP-ribose pyrophosphatase
MQKIPSYAKVVFKGVLHDTYQWEQVLFDGTTTTFEVIYRRPGLTVLAVTEDKKMIVNFETQPNAAPFYTFPGGNSETGDFLDCAKRELLEETGYVSEKWLEWMTTDPLNYVCMEWRNIFFIARNCKKVAEQNLEAGEQIQVSLVSFEDFLELAQRKDFRNKEISNLVKEIKDDAEKLEAFRKEIFGS